ncbi:hypothetical protein IQ243_04115 [Nostocales cyanobacterium LEGE 11386]|nr:hypothetical protein [Nostocales cyanobacterium LEGE 11386]
MNKSEAVEAPIEESNRYLHVNFNQTLKSADLKVPLWVGCIPSTFYLTQQRQLTLVHSIGETRTRERLFYWGRSQDTVALRCKKSQKHLQHSALDFSIPRKNNYQVFVILPTLATRDRKENTGIDLAMGKKILETEGGTMTLESNAAVGGTFPFTWTQQLDE